MMHARILLIVSLGLVLFLHVPCRGQTGKDLGFSVPDGFEVSLYADDVLATDIHSLTIDAKGRVVVAGKGYIKILHDTNGDGKADKATLFADFPKSGAHGMVFDGNDLICDGDQGVRRLLDTDGDGKYDKVGPAWFPTKNDGEHAANGIVRGPDGWYYLITGNDAGITRTHANGLASPVKDPNSGAVVRFSPDGKTREVVAHGFRNPYDLAFNHLGHMFTVDADGERVHHMPYYAPTRLFDIAQGMHHGWLLPGWQGGWSRPAWWPDNVNRAAELGRGSPTGLIVYRHRAFPERYRNGVFSLCWTFGRVYFLPLTRNGSTYVSKMEVFMKTTGDVGFAPTDMAVGPDGDLFVAIGGRGTRGSVFRVRYTGTRRPSPDTTDALRSVLAADEPLSSWSRVRWVPAAEKLGKRAFLHAAANEQLPLEERIRAVEIVTDLFGGMPVDAAKSLCVPKVNPELTCRALWSLSRSQDAKAAPVVAAMTSSADPRVGRSAWEALLVLGSSVESVDLNWQLGLESPERRVRAAAIRVAQGPGWASFLKWYSRDRDHSASERLARVWVLGWPSLDHAKNQDYARTCLDVYQREKRNSLRLEAVRLLQIGLGDVNTDDVSDKPFVGHIARSPRNIDAEMRMPIAVELAKVFPTGDRHLDLEAARLLGMLSLPVPGLLDGIAGMWTNGSRAEDDIHYLLVLSQLPGRRSSAVSHKTAAALAGIHVKLAARGAKPTDQVPGILEALLERLMSLDPTLAAALVADRAFGLPGHALYANKLPLPEQQAAARKLLAHIAGLDEGQARAAWDPDLVRLVSALPDKEALPVLRAQFADPRLTDTVALRLAKVPRPEDRARLIEALGSTQTSVVSLSARALVTLTKNGQAKPNEIGKAVRALRRLETQKADVKSREAMSQLLVHWAGMTLPKSDATAWVDWFTKTYPGEAAALTGLASADFAAWKKRLNKVDWQKAEARRGEVVFQRKNCFRCHGETRRLGPDLVGVAQRFGRDDLFLTIIDPNKDIAPAYQATSIVTSSGKVHSGVVVYSSPDVYLLQTAPDTTVRIPREELQLVQPSSVSFMPSGLLDDLNDAELADLYAFLKNLRKQ